MTLPQRHVKHLRLVAGSEDAARAALPRLEDALRCASLPDAGSRLLLVRRLALGRLPWQASSQSIARVVEARFADGGVAWTEGAADDQVRAERVVFASAWHARVALSIRLLRGERVGAWYWPLAVPEFRAGLGAGDNLRAIAAALARSAEAQVALPAWAVRVVRAAGAQGLIALLPERFGEALLREAGLPLPIAREATATRVAVSIPRDGAALAGEGLAPHRGAVLPPWLRWLLRAGGWREAVDRAGEAGPASPRAQRPSSRPGAHAHVPISDTWVAAASEPAVGIASGRSNAQDAAVASSDDAFVAADAASADALPRATDVPDGDMFSEIDSGLRPTEFAGLPFLLPVLGRLGLARWVEAGDGDAADWTRAVLAAALLRLQAPADDPAWALVAPSMPLPRIGALAPPVWQNLLLARRGPLSRPLPQALAEAATADAQVALWLTAVRRWLRRGARVGLATLVHRPGKLSLTPTHLDMHFALSTVDLRVRRTGLDIDPGWLPWFGRVVHFQYDEDAP